MDCAALCSTRCMRSRRASSVLTSASSRMIAAGRPDSAQEVGQSEARDHRHLFARADAERLEALASTATDELGNAERRFVEVDLAVGVDEPEIGLHPFAHRPEPAVPRLALGLRQATRAEGGPLRPRPRRPRAAPARRRAALHLGLLLAESVMAAGRRLDLEVALIALESADIDADRRLGSRRHLEGEAGSLGIGGGELRLRRLVKAFRRGHGSRPGGEIGRQRLICGRRALRREHRG